MVSPEKRFQHKPGQLDQYYHIYNARLDSVRETLIKASRDRWGENARHALIEELNGSLGTTEVFVIGTLFKLMPQQPSILRELEDQEVIDLTRNFTSDEDSLILHETDENVQVVGAIDVHVHVTGIPVSLLGQQLNGGAKFNVTSVCYAGPDLSVYRALPEANSYKESGTKTQKLVIVSGLEFGFDSVVNADESKQIIEALKNFREFIAKRNNEYEIVKVIIAGNSVASGYTKAKAELMGAAQIDDRRTLKEVFQMFDKYLFTLAQSGVELDVMPGKNDPASFLLPQQPFHPKLLPKSGVLENVHPITNPCLITCNDQADKPLKILGTSGENVESIRQYSRIEFSTTALKNTLEWGHIAPLAPDNLSCVPFKQEDPFIIDYVPDLYFAGNQPEFAVTTYSSKETPKIQLISVPVFAKTLSAVIVNLTDLDVELKCFS